MKTTRQEIGTLVEAELAHAYSKHGRERWGAHEFYGILMEEIEEAWECIRKDDHGINLRDEIIQVIAVCYRYLETGDRYRSEV